MPSRETGKGETVRAFVGLCLASQSADFHDRIGQIRDSGWTVYEAPAASASASDVLEAPLPDLFEASSRPGDECGLHVTYEADPQAGLRCEVVVSRFCELGNTDLGSRIIAGLDAQASLIADPVSTFDENRRQQEHHHRVFRSDGALVRYADTGGTIYLSAVSPTKP